MATGADSTQLTQQAIVRLASVISTHHMTAIAEGYMDIDEEIIRNKKLENRDDAEAFNKEIIRYWMKRNPDSQRQVR